MIINIRGTSGSGKSTLVRNVLACYESRTVFKEPSRRQPIGYLYHRRKTLGQPGRSLAVVGHYETACGGCDTIPNLERTFELVRQSHAAGHDVLFEGLLISSEVNRTVALHTDGLPLQIIALDTPLDICIESINQRRWAKNPDKPPVATKNTTSKHRAVELSMKRFKEAGLDACWLSRMLALDHVKKELGL